MSNIYWMNTIRRKSGEVKHLGLQTYQGWPGITKMYYGSGSDDYYRIDIDEGSLESVMDVGAQSMELNPGSKTLTPFRPHNALPYFRLISDVKSWQWVVLQIGDDINRSTLCDNLAANNMFEPSDEEKKAMPFYLDDRYIDMSIYPYVYEYTESQGEITAQKLTTYSEVNPTTVLGDKHQGDETARIYSTGEFHGISSSWTNKVKTAWSGYTSQLTGGTVKYGFIALARGAYSSSLTTRGFIRYFLQRCTNIDTTNDWTHIRLT